MPTQDRREMDSSDKLIEELAVAVDAAIGIIGIRCPATEVFRVQDAIFTFAASQELEFRSWMISTGWAKWPKVSAEDIRLGRASFDPMAPTDNRKTTNSIAAAFGALKDGEDAEFYPQEGLYVMVDAHYYLDDPAFISSVRNQLQRALTVDQRLFVIIPDYVTVPDAITPLMHMVEFELPSRNELTVSFNDIISQVDEQYRPSFDAEDMNLLLGNSAGMTKTSFDSAVSLAITEYSNSHGNAEGLNLDTILHQIRHYKTQMLRKTNVLELIEPLDIDQVGGLDQLKEWLAQRKESFTEAAIQFGITPLKGFLVVGPPGGGKSLVAKATCAALGLPGVRFDIGRIFNSYIGQSEQAMRNVLKLIDDLAPCVMFADEIDKGFSGMQGGNDSGTTSRVFGTFLTWMQERDQKTRPVCIAMSANRVAHLPAELLRKGRVDEIWGVGYPNAVERAEIIRIHTTKRGHKLTKAEAAEVVMLTETLIGAEIESLVESALNRDFTAGNDSLTLDSLKIERDMLRPQAITMAAQMKEMEDWIKTNARPASSSITAEQVEQAAPVKKKPLLGRKLRVNSKKHDS